MIDIEPEVFSAVEADLREAFPTIAIASLEEYSPSQFPFVSFVEADNYALTSSRDTASNENHAVLMYEANVFSNRRGDRKSECKTILSVIDSTMDRLGFTRTSKTAINLDGAAVYRIASRYTAVVGKNKTIYRR